MASPAPGALSGHSSAATVPPLGSTSPGAPWGPSLGSAPGAGLAPGPSLAPSLAALAGCRRGYYYRAVVYCLTPEIGRPEISRNRAAEQYRIRDLTVAWGTRLDGLRASLQMIRWIADAHRLEFHPERERRYHAVLRLLESCNDRTKLWKDFGALKANMPKVGRAAARVATRAKSRVKKMV